MQKILFSLLFALAAPLAWAGEERPIRLSEVPAPVIQGLKQLLPKSILLSANTEQEAGQLVYEVQGKLEDGRKFEFDALADGEVEEIELEFKQSMVPGAVLKAIEKKLPGFRPSYIEASHSASMKVIAYEFVGQLNGVQVDLEVSPDGRQIVLADS
ncbi:MAG: hypothetical protein OIF38_17470 [Cellvibrionaceae bacterium]|nr:hypothetical protein [Cellvibrionaceae bacterium]